jgi:hypothetical protein
VPAGLTWTGVAATIPGWRAVASTTRAKAASSAGLGSAATSSNGPLNPGPREFAGALRAALGLAPARPAVPAGAPAVASTDWASVDRPADRPRQATQPRSAPAKGSTLLQPTPPGAAPSRPRRSAADRSRGISRFGVRGLVGLVVAAVVGLAAILLVNHHGPKAAAPAADRQNAVTPAAAGPPVNPAQQPSGVSRIVDRIVAVGNRIVTTGSQTSDGVARQQFYASVNGGATWYLARLETPGGRQPAPGHVAIRIAGGPRGWLAEGPQAVWTRANGLTWTLAATHGISPQLPSLISGAGRP